MFRSKGILNLLLRNQLSTGAPNYNLGLYRNSPAYFSTSQSDRSITESEEEDDTGEKVSKRRREKSSKKKKSLKAQLIEKNKERVKHLLKEMVHLIVHGSKSIYKDLKFVSSVVSWKPRTQYTVEELQEIARIKRDIIKFIPFYAIIIIPFAEAVLPVYLLLFPRAIPSCFVPEKQLKEQKYKYIDNQAKAFEVLKDFLLTVMIRAGYDPSVKDHDKFKEFFVNNKKKILPILDIDNLDSETLRYMCDFRMFEYVEGTYILNTLYRHTVNFPRYIVNGAMWATKQQYRMQWEHPFFNPNFKMNWFPFEPFKKALLKSQLKSSLKLLRNTNYALLHDHTGKLSDEAIIDIARERGFETDEEELAKKWLKEEWSKISKENLENDQFLFWYAVLNYSKKIFD